MKGSAGSSPRRLACLYFQWAWKSTKYTSDPLQESPMSETPAPERKFELPPGYDGLAEARRLLRGMRAGSLATLDASGAPFASLVNVATAFDGAPLLLMSALSAHTQFLDKDARASLLLAETGKGDPLAHPRLTVSGAA